MLVKEEVRVS